MSGHSKWSTIRHKKSIMDARRSKLFTKLIREITVAARLGGGDPSGNPRLRRAIEAAKAANMPAENIERAIKKGTGELEGANYEEVVYEGYGPEGVAIMVEVLTDNKKRTVSEIRHLFNKYNGSLGSSGCVSWMFEDKGIIVIDKKEADEDKILEATLDVEVEDIKDAGGEWEVLCSPENFDSVKKAIESAGIKYERAEITKIPQTVVKLEGKSAETLLKLISLLEDHDDVQHVYSNFEISDDIIEKFSG